MKVRDAKQTDYPSIAEIHREMGMDYRMPDLNSPLFIVRKVTTDEEGKVIGACFLRLTAETYLWLPPNLHPRDKVQVMKSMQPEVMEAAWIQGIDETEARIPEPLERRFQKRLVELGWSKDRPDWHPWSRQTGVRP